MLVLSTTCGDRFLIDEDSLQAIEGLPFYSNYAETQFGTELVSIITHAGGKTTPLARVIMRAPDDMLVDHANGDVTDNRKANLRLCSYSENNRNRRAKRGTTLGLKGVSKSGIKYRAQIYLDGKNTHLGLFDTAEDAHKAYAQAAQLHYGAFARIQ